jgi:hypothetical protein
MRSTLPLLLFACLVQASPRLIVKLDPSTGTASRDGRLIVIVSKEMNGEPRSQVTWGVQTQQIFGQEVDAWKPGSTVEMAADTPGDPLHTLADLPSGSYMCKLCSTSIKLFTAPTVTSSKFIPTTAKASDGIAREPV